MFIFSCTSTKELHRTHYVFLRKKVHITFTSRKKYKKLVCITFCLHYGIPKSLIKNLKPEVISLTISANIALLLFHIPQVPSSEC